MNGAESLIATLAAGGVEVCFANPGTSELHLLAAMDRTPKLRCVLVLFEGVATGAADGYARLAGKPACTLLHLGPGWANGLANLHNAVRASVPMLNLVGQHPEAHLALATPLRSDIEALARPYSDWLRTTPSARTAGKDAAEALAAALRSPGQVATLIVPADAAWQEGGVPAVLPPLRPPPTVPEEHIEECARRLRDEGPAALLLDGSALHGAGLQAAGRIARAGNARLLTPYPLRRLERGASRPCVERIPYVLEQAQSRLAELRTIVLVGTRPPAAYFAYPGVDSRPAPARCTFYEFATADQDLVAGLAALADALDAAPEIDSEPASVPAVPRGAITLAGVAQAIAATLPEGAIVVDESMTSGRGLMAATRGCPPHDWLANTGGSIGIAMPLATGAALAAPERPVLCLSADGSGAYTAQALWTMARAGMPVTTVIFANHRYGVLENEFGNLGLGEPGASARDCLELRRPELDWISLARGFGVAGARVEDLDRLVSRLRAGYRDREPSVLVVEC